MLEHNTMRKVDHCTVASVIVSCGICSLVSVNLRKKKNLRQIQKMATAEIW